MSVSNNSERQRKFHHRLKSLMDMKDINGIEQHNYEMTAAFEIEITEVQSQRQSLTYINTIDTDQLAEALIPGDVPTRNIRAVKTTGDGNCLYYSVSLALSGKETYSDQLRLLTSCELYLNADYYASHPKLNECLQNPITSTSNPNTLFSYILSDEGDTEFMKSKDKISVVRYEGRLNIQPKRWCSLLQAMALASIIKQNIYLIYPDCNNGIRPLLNGNISPRTNLVNNKTVHILWSRDGNLDNTPRAAYHPNHFVYIHKIYDNVKDNNELENQSDNKKKDEVEQPPLKKQKTFQVKIDAWFQKKITQIKNDAQPEKKEQISTQEEETEEQISTQEEEKKEQVSTQEEEKKEQISTQEEEKKEQISNQEDEKKEQISTQEEEKKEQVSNQEDEQKEQISTQEEEKKEQISDSHIQEKKKEQFKIDAWFQKKITQIKNDAQAEKKEQISTQEEEKKEQISDSHIPEEKKEQFDTEVVEGEHELECSASSSYEYVDNHMTEDSSNKTQSETLGEEEAPQINFKLRSQLKGNLDDEKKYSLIKNRIPPQSFQFPKRKYKDKTKTTGERTRSCQHQWFSQFDFITYDTTEDGIYCLPCILFPCEISNTPGGRAKALIDNPYTNWKDAVCDLKNHAVSSYHKSSMVKMKHFVQVAENTHKRIDNILDIRLRERIEKNRTILKSIIRCIEYCGRQGQALRSHRDDGTCFDILDKNNNSNAGNLKELFKLCAVSGDTALKEHLETCSKNASYTSKTAQNELLHCIKTYIQNEIITRVKIQPHGPLFGIQADEVTDSSDIEQLGLVLRYLDNDNPVEKVIEYIECKSTTGESIAENILAKVQELGLSMKNCRSQSYDGAGNMSGKYNGCAARIKRLYPRAEYYYCMNHDLNLAVSKSCKVPEMQIMIESTKQLGIFFKYSPKRQKTLETSLTAVNNQRQQDGCTLIKCYKLKTLCETRWVERHTTLQNISHIYEAIVHCLTAITSRNTDCNWDTKSVTEASGLLMHITNSKWIVAINVYLHFSGYLRTLSVLLQGPTEDILSAFQKVSVVTNELKSIRESCDEAFCDVWENVNKMANLVGTEISIPRVCGRQTKRNNVSADTPQQYWMRTLFIPYVDHLIMEFGSRFTHASRTSTLALCLLPAHLTLLSNEKVDEIKEFFIDDIPSSSSFKSEVSLWKREWEESDDKPDTIEKTLSQMNTKFYPNIAMILRVLLLLPVSAATVERGNSFLKLVKSKKRSTMGEDRMNGLLLLNIHRDIKLDHDAILDSYARANGRRMKLLNPLSH